MSVEAYEVGQRSDKCGVDLVSDALPFGRLYTVSRTQSTTQSNTRSTAVGSRMDRGQFFTYDSDG